jgi:glycosyltransferase involved in cell wall biosynthesis
MGNPLVSIAIIAYNQIGFIEEAINNAVVQDFDNLEVVVADDGSTDNSAEVIQYYAQEYPDRIVPLVGGPNLGITGNSNRALKACRGKYICFQGGDDVLLPGKVTRQVDWMEADEQRILCGHDIEIFESSSGRILALWSDIKPLRSGEGAASVIRYGAPFATSSLMVRASSIPPYGFDPRVSLVSDWKLWIDCLANGGKFGYIDGIYARYRTSEFNASRRTQAISQDTLVTLSLVESTYPELIKYCKYTRARTYYELGIYYMKKQQYQQARRLFQSALSTAFISWKQPIALLFTYLPVSWSYGLLQDRPIPRSVDEILLAAFKKQL